jgi:GT2 family glycosyltransferase/glycosyltransferase involved in cell wall biosynthesis
VIKDIPASIARVILSRGTVYIRTGRAQLDKGVSLAVGRAQTRFEEVPEDEVALFAFPQEYRPAFDKTHLGDNIEPRLDEEGKSRPAFETMLNDLPDWTLEGHDTLQLRMVETDAPARFEMAAPIALPPHGKDFLFSALLGIHRGTGRLLGRVEDMDGKLLESFEVPFDTGHHGGRYMQGYKPVVRPLLPAAEPSRVRLAVLFDARIGEPDSGEPYFFIADPHVFRKPRPNAEPAEELHSTPRANDPDQLWARAPVPALLSAGSDLVLQARDGRSTLKSGRDVRLMVEADYGHTLMMRATEAGNYSFQIDGKPAFQAFVGTEPTALRLPSRFFNGETRTISAWDGGGVQRFLLTHMLMPRLLTPMEVLRQESRPPYPGTISTQTARRFAGVRAQMLKGLDPSTLEQVGYALTVLEGGHENVRLQPMFFPEVEEPDVSIVIPAHNKVEVTYLALASLLVAANEASFEVIVVDDASTDATNELEMLVEGITVLHNPTSERFIRACNSGVSVARGKYVVLLNNDTEVTAGWLDELIAAFHRFPNVGLVGSKLLYPDGLLQDAGGIVWGSGNPWQYGNGQNPWEPRFCYARQADYLSGAALMTTRAIWDEVGGLSAYLEPMYFEDTDFAFKVREAGYTTWFVPSSIVYHYEGMTSGTDTSSGHKRFQEINRPKFKRRWAGAFQGGGKDGVDPDLEKDRGIAGRVLFIDHGTPRPDRDAGSYAAVQEMRLVQSLGYKVTFLPVNLAHLGSYTEELERLGIEMLHAPYVLSVSDFLERRAEEFDAFFITRWSVAESVIEKIKLHAANPRILFNNADLHFLRELRAALAADDPEMREAAALTRDRELAVMREVDVVLSYNETEHSVIESHTDGEVKVVRCPWVVEVPEDVPGREGRSGLSFLGNYGHPPNAEGVEWFARQVMPLVNGADPGLAFWIYGSGMTDAVHALRTGTVHPEGFVDQVADAYDRHRIFVAPLLSGAGIKGKVLAALAHGIPCVLSPVAAEGIGLRHGLDCMIAKTPQEWAEAIARLQQDDQLWDRISQNARAYVRETFSFEIGRKWMREAFEAADLFTAAEV